MGKDEIKEVPGKQERTDLRSRDLAPAPIPRSESPAEREADFLTKLKAYQWAELEDEEEPDGGDTELEAETAEAVVTPGTGAFHRDREPEAGTGARERKSEVRTGDREPKVRAWVPVRESGAKAAEAARESEAKAAEAARESEAKAVREKEEEARAAARGRLTEIWAAARERENRARAGSRESDAEVRPGSGEGDAEAWTGSGETQAEARPGAGGRLTEIWAAARKSEAEAWAGSGEGEPEAGPDSRESETEARPGAGGRLTEIWAAAARKNAAEAWAGSGESEVEAGPSDREGQREAETARWKSAMEKEKTGGRFGLDRGAIEEKNSDEGFYARPGLPGHNQEPPEDGQQTGTDSFSGSVRVTDWFTGPEEADEWPEERQGAGELEGEEGSEEDTLSKTRGKCGLGPGESRGRRSRKRRKRGRWLNGPAAVLNGLFKPSDGLWAAFCVPVAVMVVIFWQRGIFPFGEESFLRTDMYHQYAPFFSEFQHKLSQGGSLLYSWNIGMGVNFTALYAYYLASPLNWLLLLCPQKLVIEFMTYGIVLKIGLSGLTFAYYLKKHCERNDFGVGFFGIFYALSGYMAAYSWNIMWLDCILLFPLVMLGLERLVEKKDGLMYGICLGLCILSNYYISIMICIFMVIYFAALLILGSGQHKTARDYVAHGIQFSGYSLLAGGAAAAVLIPEVYALRMTVSMESSFPKTITSYFSIFDMFARHIGNVETEIGLDHWPNIYCGVAVLMLFTLYLACDKIRLKEKAVYCGLLLMFFASFSVNALNFIWHGFHFPNSLPCRQSFIYIFLMLVICYRAYTHLASTPWKRVVKAFWGAVGFVILAEKLVEQKHFEFYVYYVAILFLSLYAGLLYLYKKQKVKQGVLLTLVMAAVAMEAAANTTITSVTTTSRTSYTKDNDDVRKLTQSLIPSGTFFRVEKVTRKTKNDGAWMNFPSVSLFSSTANSALTDFFKEVGCEGNTNAYSITGSTPFVDSLFSVRYGLYSSEQDNELLELIDQSGDTWLYRRLATLPVGFLVSPDLEMDWQRDLGNPAEVQNNLCDVIGAERVLLSCDGENYGSTFRLMPEMDGDYYVYVANKKVKEVKVKIGEETRTFSNVNRGFLLELGQCAGGVEIEITNEEDSESLNARAYRFSNEGLWSAYEILARNPFTITKWKDTCLEGEVHAVQDGVLFTSVPYDKGWTVEVDGKKQETKKIFDTFLSVDIPEGTHEITMSYEPEGLRMSVGVSLVSVLCLAGIAGFRYWKKRQEGDKDTEEDIRRKISEKRRAKA